MEEELKELKARIKEIEKKLIEKKCVSKEELENISLTSSVIQECKIINEENEIITIETKSYRGIFVEVLKTFEGRDAIILLNNTKPGKHTDKGYSYIQELQISFYGKDANLTWKDIIKLVEHKNYKINITIQLKNNTIIYYDNN